MDNPRDALSIGPRSHARPTFDWLNGDVRELRERYERAYRVEDRGASDWLVEELEDRRIRLLIQRPADLSDPDCAILYFHGGGWIVGSPSTHADVSRSLCERTGLTVVSVDYRLAPEFVAPAPVADGLAVLERLFSAGIGGRGAKSAILCGDSAGGAVALAVERQADAALRQRILGVASLYGGFGLLDSASLSKGSRADGMDAACIARYWSLAHAPGVASPYSIAALAVHSPVPAYLLAASDDPVLDDTLALAAAFDGVGRPYVLDCVEGGTHGFLHETGSPAAASGMGRIGAWMRRLREPT